MGKLVITKKQEEAFEFFKRQNFNLEDFVDSQEHWKYELEVLRALTVDEMARLLYEPGSYEVEEAFAVGDWVVNVANGRVAQIDHRGIDSLSVWVHDEEFNFFAKDQTRHATPEEIKAEKERRLWKSIGRDYRELKIGDKYTTLCGFNRTIDDNFSKELFQETLKDSRVQKFYPVESSISFGGSDD